MIIIHCTSCDTRYKFDETNIKRERIKVRCKSCNSILLLEKKGEKWKIEPEDIINNDNMKVNPSTDEKNILDSKETLDNHTLKQEINNGNCENIINSDKKDFNGNCSNINSYVKNIHYKYILIYINSFIILSIFLLNLNIFGIVCYILLITIYIPVSLLLFQKHYKSLDRKNELIAVLNIAIIIILTMGYVFFSIPDFLVTFLSMFYNDTIFSLFILIVNYLSFFKTSDDFIPIKKSIDIERGVPIEVVDTLGNLLSLPSKILLLNPYIDSHNIDKKYEKYISEFIEQYKLYDVKVRLNQYAPLSEFQRIFMKNHMNILFRLFFGVFYFIGYLLNIGRLFGGDNYSPVTNSVNIYSNNPSIILHELGHALDFRRRKYPGLYMILKFIPFVSLYQEYKASLYAIEFLKKNKYYYDELCAYKILFPAYSTYIFGGIYEYLPSTLFVWIFTPIIIIGHIIGWIFAKKRKDFIFNNDGVTIEKPKSSIGLNKRTWMVIIAILPGFIIGFYLFNIIGAIIGAVGSYFIFEEYLKYREAAKRIKNEVS